MNKLGLTGDDRFIDYATDTGRGVGELRHFDPIVGLLQLYDSRLDSKVEFLYDHSIENGSQLENDLVGHVIGLTMM